MFRIILLSLLTISITPGKAQMNQKKSKNTDCFSSENFLKAKDYINSRIMFSGMGKFYVEFPPDPDHIYDGIMRPSNHPENVFDTYIDQVSDQINFENKMHKFVFHSKKGLLNKKNLSKKDKKLAFDIFCYLVQLSKK